MRHNTKGINSFTVKSVNYFNTMTTTLTAVLLQDNTIPLTFTVDIGVEGGCQGDKDFVAFGLTECMNSMFNKNVELERSGVTFIIKESV